MIIRQLKILGLGLLFIAFSPIQIFAHNPETRELDDGNLFHHYSWFEIFNPFLLITLVLAYLVYFKIMKKYSVKCTAKQRLKKKIAFIFGLLFIYVSLAGPLSILSNNLIFSAHMLQQSFMYIVMPPLILLGMPIEFYKFLDKKLFKLRPFRILKFPLVNLFLFNMLWSFYHLPQIYEFFLEQFILLEILHIILNTTAFLMWIPVFAPERRTNELSFIKKIGYMFANGVLITPACALIIFAGSVIYPSIHESPQLLTWFTPLNDQQLGGIIMKVVQEISYGAVITYVFFNWARTERAKDSNIDELPSVAVK